MFKVLIDTCVWLELAKDHRHGPVISALEELVAGGLLELITPETTVEEFERNKVRVIEETKRSLQSHFRLVREAVERFGHDSSRNQTLEGLKEVDHTIALKAEAVTDAITKIGMLLHSSPPLPVTNALKQRVTERALAKKAPYHRDKNSVADAVIIETYAELLSSDHTDARFAFVTHNTRDFSLPDGDRRQPHSDLALLFDGSRSRYSVAIAELIHEIDPDLLSDHQLEFELSRQSRSLSEILDAENLLFRQVWYNRHCNLRAQIDAGVCRVVPEAEYSRKPYKQDEILDTVWAQALAAARRTEDEVGADQLGPWTDFEWGMLNGKLSALRWVLGDDWDMLDT